jgi:small nuclear ribonucleoprotein
LSSSSPSSQQQPKRPLTTLQRAINRKVAVRLKSEIEYKGRMNNVDSYMNLILTDAEEFNGSDVLANYGKVVIRGNNVLFIKLEKEFEPCQVAASLVAVSRWQKDGCSHLKV